MIITRRPLLLGAAAASLMTASAYAQTAADFMGEWYGALDLGSQRLRLAPGRSPTDRRATLYSIDQGNSAIPVGETRIDGAATHARPSLSSAPASSGRLSDGRIEGQFTQGGTLPLVFAREQSAEARPPAEALTQARLAALRAQAGAPAFAAAAANRERPLASPSSTACARSASRSRVTTSDQWHLARSPSR